ncbi:MAG: hypothetical protein ACMXYG_07495 [Candidatus Woesearchaeota archaeon]
MDEKNNSINVSINTSIYDLDVIYTTCYSFLDKNYIEMDGNPEKEIIITIKPKNEKKNNNLEEEFRNSLIRFGFYKKQQKNSLAIRTLMLQKILELTKKKHEVYIETNLAEDIKKQIDIIEGNTDTTIQKEVNNIKINI